MLQHARRFWRRLVDWQANGQAPEERRSRSRYPSDLATAVRPLDGEVRLPARVQDVSCGGVGLVVHQALEPGEVLGVEVPAAAGPSTSVVLACVVHVRPHGEGEWVLGCSFSEDLSGEDLVAFG